MFYLESGNKIDCCGCRACEHICPKNCIKMLPDDEGFYYPVKNEDLCVHCDLCKKVCPNVNKNKILNPNDGKEFRVQAYMAIHRDKVILDRSASGGVFSAIVNSYCKNNFVIFGVELDENLNAIHSYTESIRGIEKYRKSKYIQSDINDSYKKTEMFLKAGKQVLFTGTPCQIAGLRLYLRKNYENLLCVDLVCHGVPSQKIFNYYKDYLEKKYRGKITSFTFRHKTYTKSKGWNSRNVKVIINEKMIAQNSQQDLYLRGYHSALFYRPSCYECKYANSQRISDITMADFWGVEKLYLNEDVHKGVSVFLVNTSKGQQLVQKMQNEMKLKEVDKQYVVESNRQLRQPARLHPKRQKFFNLLKTKTFEEVVNRCIPKPSLFRRVASKVLPKKGKDLIKKIIR